MKKENEKKKKKDEKKKKGGLSPLEISLGAGIIASTIYDMNPIKMAKRIIHGIKTSKKRTGGLKSNLRGYNGLKTLREAELILKKKKKDLDDKNKPYQ